MKDNNTVRMTSVLEVLGFLKTNGTGCRFVSLVTDTPVVKIRRGNPWPGLRKVARRVGLINANYNRAVRNRIAQILGVELKEVEYENGKTWYVHLQTVEGKALPVCVHGEHPDNGEYYLQFFAHKQEYQYVTPDGTIIPEEQVKPWLYKTKDKPAFKPDVIAPSLKNIKEFRASGLIVELPGLDEAEKILEVAIDVAPKDRDVEWLESHRTGRIAAKFTE